MENIDKLMIITSPNGDEYGSFWNLKDDGNTIIKNGYEGDYKIIFESPELEYFEEIAPDLTNFLVMVHFYPGETPRLMQRSYQKGNKTIFYYLYYYSSLETELNGDLWSIGDNYRYCGPMDSPHCPFDQLRMDIVNGNDTSASVHEVITWVKSKTASTNILDLKLNILHQCLTPETAREVFDLPQYHLLKDRIVENGLTVDEFVKKHLIHEKANDMEQHDKMLTVLRDALLEEEEKAVTG